MTDLDSFVLSLWENPEEDLRRLAFADFLGDANHPLESWVRESSDSWQALAPFGVVGEKIDRTGRQPIRGANPSTEPSSLLVVQTDVELGTRPAQLAFPAACEFLELSTASMTPPPLLPGDMSSTRITRGGVVQTVEDAKGVRIDFPHRTAATFRWTAAMDEPVKTRGGGFRIVTSGPEVTMTVLVLMRFTLPILQAA